MLFWPIKLAFRLVSLLVFAIVIYLVVSGVQVVTASRLPAAPGSLTPASTIVVLGTAVDGSSPSPDLLGRLQAALSCYQAHLAPTIVVTGAAASGASPSVSDVAKTWLVNNGVPASAVTELSAGDASAGLTEVASSIAPQTSVVIATDALNADWTKDVAHRDGLAVQIAPANGSERPFYQEIQPLWSQASAVAVGRINRILGILGGSLSSQ